MFKKTTFFACAVWALGSFQLFAQGKLQDTVLLHEIIIGPSRQMFSTGYSTTKIGEARKKEYEASTLNALLSEQTGLTVYSYGPAGLAAVSIRGTGANHTAVVWNGINLQSTMNGGADLSLMSPLLFDQVGIQQGGSSALYGSGAIGGVVFLNNSKEVQKGIRFSASQHIGSFGMRNSAFVLNIGSERFSSSTKISVFGTENNFPFKNEMRIGSPMDTVRDASQHQLSFMQSLNWKINANNSLSLNAWLMNSRYHIARTMLQTDAPSKEDNYNSRFVAAWNQRVSIFNNTARLAILHDEMHYSSPSFNSWHLPTVATAEYESQMDFDRNHSLDIGVQGTMERATSTDYEGTKSRDRLALFGAYKQSMLNNKFNIGINARGEMVDADLSPLTASLGWEYLPFQNFTVKGTASRNFKLPTFNDLYWKQGGNINLKPENGWSSDLGVELKSGNETFDYKGKLTAFCSLIKDRIVWTPGTSGIYTPQNFDGVWSRGAEISLGGNIRMPNMQIGCDLNYSYTLSNKENEDGHYSDIQMLYLPIHKLSAFGYIAYQKIRMSYTHKIEGLRYYSENKTDHIKGYGLGNLNIGTSILLSKTKISFGANINNIWNTSYQVMPWYPMPMRNFGAFISFEFGN